MEYENGDLICEASNLNSSWTYEFDCACSAPDNYASVEDLTYDVNGYTINLSWTAPEGAVNYYILRNGLPIGETTETSFSDDILNEITFTYCVFAEYPDGGVSMPECIVIKDALEVMDEEEAVSVYPNPVNSTLYINGGNTEYSYEMFNGMGQRVISGNAQGAQEINVKEFAKGIYILRLTTGSQVSIQKIVVE